MKNVSKIKKVGITAALTTSMVGSLVAGTYAEMGNGITPAPAPKDGNVQENNSVKPVDIIEAEKNFDLAKEELKSKKNAYDNAKKDLKYDEKQSEVDKTSEALAKSQEKIKDKEKAVEKASSNLENAKSEQEKAKNAHDKAVEEKDKAKKAYDDLVAENPDAAKTIEQDKENLKKAEADLADKKAALEEAKTKEAEAKKLKEEKEAEANAAKEALTKAQADLDEKTEAKNQAEQALKDAEDKLNALTRDNPAYQKAKEAVEAAENELNEKKEELTKAEQDYNAAKADADEKEQAYEELKTQSESISAKRTELENTLKGAQNKVTEINKELEEANSKKEQLNSKKTEADNALTNAKNSLKTAEKNAEEAKTKLIEANNAVEEATKALHEADADFAIRKGRGTLGFIEWVLKEKDSTLTEDQKYDLNRAKTLIENALNEDVSSWAPDLKNKKGNPITGLEPTKGKTAGLNYENDAISYNNFKEALAFLDETEKYIKESTDPYRKAYVRYLRENNQSLLTNDGVAYTSFTAIVGAQINSNRDGFYLGHNPKCWNEGGHAEVLHSSDNAFISINDSSSSWIYGEKIYFDKAANELGITDLENLSYEDLKKIESKAATLGVIGHYTFFLYSNSSTVMGFGRTQEDSSEDFEFFKTNSVGQYNSSGRAKYTFSEMKALFAEYEDSFSKKLLEDELKKAQDAQQVAKSNSDKANTEVTKAKEAVKNSEIAYNNAAKELSDQENLINSIEEKKSEAVANEKAASDNLNKFNEDNANIIARLDEAKVLADKAREDAEVKKSIVDSKRDEKNEAEQNLEKAQTDLDAVNADITKARKAVEDAQETLNKAETEMEQAKKARDDANTRASTAEQEKKKASDEYQNTVDDLNAKKEAADKAEAERDNANNKLNEDTKKFEDLTKALNDYEAKLEEEKAAKTNLDNADKDVKDKEEALDAANEAKTNAEAELSKSKAANEEAKKAFEEATKALEGKKNEYLNAVKKLNNAKIDAMMLLRLIYGDKSSVTSGVKEALKFSCNGSLKYFTGITIDGNFIPVNEYKKDSGSTVVTVPSAYWNKLSSGKHTFQFEYEYGSSPIGTFTITANEEASEQIVNQNNNAPMTGDTDGYVLLSGGLFLVSTLLLYRSLKRKEEE